MGWLTESGPAIRRAEIVASRRRQLDLVDHINGMIEGMLRRLPAEADTPAGSNRVRNGNNL